MRTVILVPRRADHDWRDRLWAWCRTRWATVLPDAPIYEGHHDANEGLFSRSAAINRAADLADEEGRWDYAVIIDGDIFIRRQQVRKALETARKTGKVTWAHRRWRGLSQEWTEMVLGGHDFGPEIDHDDMDVLVERTTPISWSCCVVVPRPVWDQIGGFDERFEGWGFEDLAFQSVVCGLYGWNRIEGDVYHLWHPRSEERIVKGQSRATASQEYLTNGRLGRRYMYALRRDYGLTDRHTPSDAEEIARDLRNLEVDDAKFAIQQARAERKRWDDWWPTLEELRDGAIAFRAEANKPAVTVIVHSGGQRQNWRERSVYLRRSLASLNAMVTGPIVQRVVYSDWPHDLREELSALAHEHGFYVAGEGQHGYTMSRRRLWSYIAGRAKGQYVFAAEDDFLYLQPVDLDVLVRVLRDRPHLVQVALLREAFYARELDSDGILGWPRQEFESQGTNGTRWLEHRLFFTANPSLFRRSLTRTQWPLGPSSERLFGEAVLARPEMRFAFLGAGEPWLRHIGETKAGAPATY